MRNAPVYRVADVCGVTLHIAVYFAKLWLTTKELAKVLGYRSVKSVENVLHKLPEMAEEHSIRADVDGVGSDMYLCDEFAVYQLCKDSNRPSARYLLKWLETGGLHAQWDLPASKQEEPPRNVKGASGVSKQLPLPEVQEIAPEEIELVAVDAQPKAPILALVPSQLPPVPDKHQERTKAYCRELLKTLLRYANDAEAEHLVQVVESEVGGLLDARYCQGLNDARYELYRRFWLQGGAK